LLELDDEDFRGFKLIFIFRSAETAIKKRKLNSGITAKDDKQKRNYNYFNDFPATWKKNVIKIKKYIIVKDINLLITWYKI
jgi:hypothetical protein